MRRLAAVVLFLSVFHIAYSQGLPSFDSTLNLVLAQYGGSALNVTNAQLAGTITYPGQASAPFTLTLQQRLLRFELQKSTEVFTVIRDDRREQAIRGTKRGFPDQLPLYSSAINLSPIFALRHFKEDQRFTRSVVQDSSGLIGLQFVESVPPGAKEPPFPQPKAIVTFWLDGTNEIQSVTYRDSQDPALQVTYQYFYAAALTSPFLQPNKANYLFGNRPVCSASIATASVNVALPPDFFAILGRN